MIEKLYNCCITRIDPYAIDDDGTINDERYMMSESIMIGCITHLLRKRKTRADRDRIREDIKFSRGLEKYEQEIRIIFNATDEYLADIIAQSVNFNHVVGYLKYIFNNIKDSDLRTKEQKKEAGELTQLIMKIRKKLRPIKFTKEKDKHAKQKKLIMFKNKSLFDGME